MKIVKDKTAVLIFKEGTQAINEFGFYMFGCIKEQATTTVPKDIFGADQLEVIQVMNSYGTLFNIPLEAIKRIKYIK